MPIYACSICNSLPLKRKKIGRCAYDRANLEDTEEPPQIDGSSTVEYIKWDIIMSSDGFLQLDHCHEMTNMID